MPDLGCSEAGASVNAIVDDECAADAAADRYIKEGRIATPGAEPEFGEASRIGVVFNDGGGDFELFADPIGQREIVPTFDLVGFLDAATGGINGAAEADAGGLEFIASETGLPEQTPEGGLDLVEDAGGAAVGVDTESLECPEGSIARSDSELELGAANLDAQERGLRHARSASSCWRSFSSGGSCAVKRRPPWRRTGGRGRR